MSVLIMQGNNLSRENEKKRNKEPLSTNKSLGTQEYIMQNFYRCLTTKESPIFAFFEISFPKTLTVCES